MDIIGVMPEPAEMKRYFFAGCWDMQNRPAGPMALILSPGPRLSIIQRVPTLLSCALAVMQIDRGREGEEEIV